MNAFSYLDSLCRRDYLSWQGRELLLPNHHAIRNQRYLKNLDYLLLFALCELLHAELLFAVYHNLNLILSEMKKLLCLFILSALFVNAAWAQVPSFVKTMVQRKEFDRAIAELERIIKENPGNMEAYYVLGNVYYEKAQNDKRAEDYRKATQNYRKVLSMKSTEKQAPVFQLQAENTIRTMWAIVFNDGVNAFNEAVQQKDAAKRNAGMDTAITKFKLAIEIVPDSMQVYMPLARAYIVEGKYAEAEPVLRKYIEYNPDDVDAYTLIDFALEKQEKFAQAVEMLEIVVRRGKATPDTYNRLMVAYIRANRISDAEKLLDKALENPTPDIKKTAVPLLRYVAQVLADSGKYEAAIAKLERALQLDPTVSDAAYNYAVYHIQLVNKYKKAFEDSVKAANKGKKKVKIPEYTGGAPYYERALQVLRPAAERENTKQYWRLMAKLYALLGRNADSKEALNRVNTAKEDS
ncbi:MAG: tetratricopeptide repeat protein [Chloroherpetonaceae bacterium]|nr:tetratricopeptide repeat protein [Chloroherpetonaceae bacterium]